MTFSCPCDISIIPVLHFIRLKPFVLLLSLCSAGRFPRLSQLVNTQLQAKQGMTTWSCYRPSAACRCRQLMALIMHHLQRMEHQHMHVHRSCSAGKNRHFKLMLKWKFSESQLLLLSSISNPSGLDPAAQRLLDSKKSIEFDTSDCCSPV